MDGDALRETSSSVEGLGDRFQVGSHLVRRDLNAIIGPGGKHRLQPRVIEVLVILAERAGEVVGHDEIIHHVWDLPVVTPQAVSRCISVLRKALGDSRSEQRVIQTISKRGYRLVVPVESRGNGRRIEEPTLAAILARCSDQLYVYDREGTCLYASEAGARAQGRTSADLVGRTWRELRVPPEIQGFYHHRMSSLFEDGRSVRQRVSYPTICGHLVCEYSLTPILQRGEIVAVLARVYVIASCRELGDAEPRVTA